MNRLPNFAAALALGCLATVVLAAAARAQTAHAPADKGSTALDGVTVAVSRNPPSVVSTFPANGATVNPGVMVLKVTFDQAMTPDGWRYAKGAAGAYPQCLETPRLLADARTFVLLCTTSGAKTYSVRFNEPDQPGFTGVGHRSALPFELTFQTAKADPVGSVPEALKAASLHDDEGPIENAVPAKPPAG